MYKRETVKRIDKVNAKYKEIITVSLILPVFRKDYLFDCLHSISNQVLNNIQCIILTNDMDFVRGVVSNFKNIYFVLVQLNMIDSGTVRNIGMEFAEGEYIGFIDEDDKYTTENALYRLYLLAKNDNYNICGGSLQIIDRNNCVLEQKKNKQWWNSDGIVNYANYQWFGGFQRFIFKREWLRQKNIKFPPFYRFQDAVFLVRALSESKKFYVISDYVYDYRKYHKKITWDVKNVRGQILSAVEICKLAEKNKYTKLYIMMLNNIAKTVSLAMNSGDGARLLAFDSIHYVFRHVGTYGIRFKILRSNKFIFSMILIYLCTFAIIKSILRKN